MGKVPGDSGGAIDVRYVMSIAVRDDSDYPHERVIGIFFILKEHVENSFEGSNPIFAGLSR